MNFKSIANIKYFWLVTVISMFFVSTLMVFYFFSTTVEDAYIVFRYVHNLINHGELVYNTNERINALTSPLHAFILYVFTFLFKDIQITNCVLSILSFIIILFTPFKLLFIKSKNKIPYIFFILLFGLSPHYHFWLTAGLETPYLGLVLFLFVWIFIRNSHSNHKTNLILFVLSGFAFSLRFDSVLFTIPVLFYIVKDNIKRLLYFVVGLIIPTIILSFNYYYYKDFLPTSFYTKSPGFKGFYNSIYNVLYSFDFLFNSGIIFSLFMISFLILNDKKKLSVKTIIQSKYIPLIISFLIVILVYGSLASRTHMMFCFRLFVPYLPVAIILFSYFIYSSMKYNSSNIVNSLIVVLSLFFSSIILFSQFVKINSFALGMSSLGELSNVSIYEYRDNYMNILPEISKEIDSHWKKNNFNTKPKISTFAGGRIAYDLPNFYIYESLVSFRKNLNNDYSNDRYSNYIFKMFQPGKSENEFEHFIESFPKDYELIWKKKTLFGSQTYWLLFYNKNPKVNKLSKYSNSNF